MRTIVEEKGKSTVIMDVFSKLIQERIIYIDGEIDDVLANEVIAQMLYLNSIDSKKQISIYINSPGGSVMDGLAIYDVSEIITAPIRTVCVSEAASMGAILMLMGDERCALKHSRIMLHEVAGHNFGKTKDAAVRFKLQTDLQKELYDIVKQKTNLVNIEEMFKLDTWWTAKEALDCGILTKIL